jgi:hypothetical protein
VRKTRQKALQVGALRVLHCKKIGFYRCLRQDAYFVLSRVAKKQKFPAYEYLQRVDLAAVFLFVLGFSRDMQPTA